MTCRIAVAVLLVVVIVLSLALYAALDVLYAFL